MTTKQLSAKRIQSNRMRWNTAASHKLGKGGLTQRIAFQLFRLHREIRATAPTGTAAGPMGWHRLADGAPAQKASERWATELLCELMWYPHIISLLYCYIIAILLYYCYIVILLLYCYIMLYYCYLSIFYEPSQPAAVCGTARPVFQGMKKPSPIVNDEIFNSPILKWRSLPGPCPELTCKRLKT